MRSLSKEIDAYIFNDDIPSTKMLKEWREMAIELEHQERKEERHEEVSYGALARCDNG